VLAPLTAPNTEARAEIETLIREVMQVSEPGAVAMGS